MLTFTACIRGNNPAYVYGQPVTLDPFGPDGWQSMVDRVAAGHEDIEDARGLTSARTLWCEPGGGYSYASASIHLASMMLRHVAGEELETYLRTRLAPLGWGRWAFGYEYAERVTHTPGAGGIVVRPTDMLRFGYLLLHEGRWRDTQVVPAWYVRHASHRSPYNPHFPYSLQFDVNTDGVIADLPRDAFWKRGSGGHVIYVVPSLDLVVWKFGGRDGQYEARDTGLEVHPEAVRQTQPRDGWTQTVDDGTAAHETLRRIIAAIDMP